MLSRRAPPPFAPQLHFAAVGYEGQAGLAASEGQDLETEAPEMPGL